MSKADLQKRLMESQLEKRKMLSPFEQLKKSTLDYFHSNLTRLFEDSPSRMTFHEVRYFDRVQVVQRHLLAFPRGVIKTALEQPSVYLDNPDNVDVNVVYKLHCEAGGKLINLYDWLMAFISVVNPDKADDDDDDDHVEVDPLLQARFTQAVSALQFLGFVKASKRKTDHVSKLTWGD